MKLPAEYDDKDDILFEILTVILDILYFMFIILIIVIATYFFISDVKQYDAARNATRPAVVIEKE